MKNTHTHTHTHTLIYIFHFLAYILFSLSLNYLLNSFIRPMASKLYMGTQNICFWKFCYVFSVMIFIHCFNWVMVIYTVSIMLYWTLATRLAKSNLYLFGLVWWHINYCRLFNPKSIFIQINSYISNNSVQHMYSFFVYTQLNIKTVLFQAIQFSINTQMNAKTIPYQPTQFSPIWPIDRTLSDAPTLFQSGHWSDGNEDVPHVPQSSRITGTSPSDCSVSYSGHSLRVGSYPSAEKQPMYSTAPVD